MTDYRIEDCVVIPEQLHELRSQVKWMGRDAF
jgi:hypothetical protein